jgi:hypothetical protein
MKLFDGQEILAELTAHTIRDVGLLIPQGQWLSNQ